jgi:TRAP-type C4-dicarboxylate transport system substrate-binding protein
MENPYHMAYWNALGATATPLAFSELYIGLQQGLVHAQENPLDIFMSSKFYEQQDYIIDTKHIAFIATILMNKEQWDSMPAEYQELMNECFEEASKFGAENAKIVEDENKQKIIEAGVEIIELDQATYDAMFEKSLSVQDMIREAVGDELVDDYLSAIEAAK